MVDVGILKEMVFFLSFFGIFALLCLGLNLQWGYTGLFNIGVAAFFAVGAYTSAILITPNVPPSEFYPGHLGFGQPFIVGVIGAILVSAFLGFLIAIPTVRLRADYLAIATIGLAEIIRLSLIQSEPITAGTIGLKNIPSPIIFPGQALLTNATTAIIIGLSVLGIYLFIELVGRSPWGRVLKAIREDEDAAVALGKNAFSYKVQAFVLGAAIMGAAGSLFGAVLTIIEPLTSFTPIETFLIWVMVILGGSGNNRGVLLGALAVWGFQFLVIRDFYLPFPIFPTIGPVDLNAKKSFLQLIFLGLLVIFIMLYRPRGILGEERVISKGVVRRRVESP